MTPAPTPATGLVVLLDVCGRSIATLSARVAVLEVELAAERALRAEVEATLAILRASHADTPSVTTSRPPTADTMGHDRPASAAP